MKSLRRNALARRGALLGFLLLLVLAGLGVDGGPAALEAPAPDPLTLPRPRLDGPLILPVDARAPEQKIVATLPLALRDLEDPSVVRVIVSLHEPLATGAAPRTTAERDRAQTQRLARVANIEHDFSESASRLGFRATLSLTHFAIVAGEISPDRLVQLAALRQVKAIEPDTVLRASTVQGKALINADELADQHGEGDGNGVVVVVIDSGIDDTHPQLAGKVAVRRTYNGPAGDVFNHGTKVAGIIAGDDGVAPAATLWDIDVLDNAGMVNLSNVVDALEDLIPNMDDIDILVGAFSDSSIPFRFAEPCDDLRPAEAQLVNEFRDAGKVLIGATGNDADGAGIGVPACLDAILATGAVYDANVGAINFGGCTDNSTAADKIACYSNGGPLVDFYAPGHCTRAPQAGGGFDNCFGGTSASAAYAAGVAAQLRGLFPTTAGAAIANALRTSGPNLNDPRSGISRRRIDAVAAFETLGGEPEPETPTPTKTVTPGGPTVIPTPTRTRTPTRTPTVPSGQAPAAPSNLTAQAVTHTAVLLIWKDNSNNESSFQIQARTGAAQFQEVATTEDNIVYLPVQGLMPSTHYDFRVRASNPAGNSTFSNVASATTAANTAPCVRDANTACLLSGRFRITGVMKNFATPPVAFETQVMSFAGGRAESEEAVFWESFEPGNFEVAVKMKDACPLAPGHPNRFYWVFFGGLTDKQTDMTIMDTVTGQSVALHNPPNHFPTTIGDTSAGTKAFPCVSPGASGSCTPNANTGCLIGGRFKVTGTMRNAQNQVFNTKVIQFAQNRAETDQAAFFQSFEPGNFEVGVKMVGTPCGLPPGHPLRASWIFYGGLTNTDTELRAVDTQTGNVNVWKNPPGSLPTSVGRNTPSTAFPCP